MRPATTEAQAELVGKGPVEIAEARIAARRGIFDLIARSGGGGISRGEQGIATADRGVLTEIVVRVEIIAADDIVEVRTDLARGAQFLAPLRVNLIAQHVVSASGGEVLGLRFAAVTPAGDRGELHTTGIIIHGQRAIGGVIMTEGRRVGNLVEVGRHVGGVIERLARLGEADVHRGERLDDILNRQLRVEV